MQEGTFGNEYLRLELSLDLGFEQEILPEEPSPLKGPFNYRLQFFHLERFRQIIISAQLHRVHGRRHGRVGGQDDDFNG